MRSFVRRSRLVAATMALALALVAFAGPVAAAPTSTPNGWCGALNMMMAGDGMFHAMTVNNPNGNSGMFTAVGNSSCR